ncbi:NADP-dependent oxidoreductase domain-containing protein [Mycena floridula]|nr:NADP-dependent oxidoreductase domain-containing protein [Mycena floridula]
MSLWSIPPPPESRLKRYRVLSPLAGVRVSPIQLGAMSIGDKWNDHGMGAMNKESSFRLLDAFFEAGGNFIDTANNYQDESSEEFLGEWAETRGIRDQLVIATKYTTGYKTRDPSIAVKAVYAGNNRKSMHLSVAASLKKLRTSYIDILYLHWYDYTTSVEEIVDGLHTLIMQGKVLYLGVSDCPAWVVREIIPMARSEGLALAPFGVLAGGKIRTDEEEKKRKESGENGQQKKVCKVLEEIAAEVGAKHITAVAIAYVMHRTPYVFPIIGGRKVEQLHANLEALEISLTADHMKRIEAATPIALGFPHEMLGNGETDGFPMLLNGTFDRQPVQPAITPSKR